MFSSGARWARGVVYYAHRSFLPVSLTWLRLVCSPQAFGAHSAEVEHSLVEMADMSSNIDTTADAAAVIALHFGYTDFTWATDICQGKRATPRNTSNPVGDGKQHIDATFSHISIRSYTPNARNTSA